MITLIRHAQSEGNMKPSLYLSKNDHEIDLTETGEAQAIALGRLISQRFNEHHTVFFSPYLRAKRTAELAMGISGLSFYNVFENPLLVERNWGSLRDKETRKPLDFAFFNRPEGGESFFDMYQRVLLFKQTYLLPNENYIVFTHGEWIKIFKMIMTNQSVENFESNCRASKVDNCGIVQFLNR